MKDILIITGGSRGIGEGLISTYVAKGFSVYSIARTTNPNLSKRGVVQIVLDLTEVDQIENAFEHIFSLIGENEPQKITLINNAGTLGRIGSLEDIDSLDISNTFNLNTIAPFVCSGAFIKLTKSWRASKTIINITSGAALKPYFGWSVYCSSKAAINMLTQTIALEQREIENGVKAFAIAPGVVDTDMQKQIRSSNEVDFKDLQRFVDLKNEGALNDVLNVGQQIFEMDHRNDIVSGSVLRVQGKN
jgi:benzil reductase ((S)-benzoin forming)